jgi:putative GTP pyrophosphokinase
MAARKTSRFRDAYKRHREEVLEPARDELKAELSSWKHERRWSAHRNGDAIIPSPVQRTRVRIKRLESIEDKIARHPDKFPGGLTRANLLSMNDLLGARIIVYFVSDLPLIDLELHQSPEIELSSSRPPTAYLPHDLAVQLGMTNIRREDKRSGYASIHYHAHLATSALRRPPHFELQVRTLAEDVWGEIEHILGYKPDKQTALQVSREFRILSKQLGAIDEQFALLYHRQRIHRKEIAIDADAPPNAENIPKVLAEMRLPVAQDEVDGLLKVMASRGIETVGELQARGTPERLHILRKTWQKEIGRPPRTFDIIAVLGTIGVDASGSEVQAKTAEWAVVAQEWSKRSDDEALVADDSYDAMDDDHEDDDASDLA